MLLVADHKGVVWVGEHDFTQRFPDVKQVPIGELYASLDEVISCKGILASKSVDFLLDDALIDKIFSRYEKKI